MAEPELLSQSEFAKIVQQKPERINVLIAMGKLIPKVIGGKKFIELTDENLEIAKRKR